MSQLSKFHFAEFNFNRKKVREVKKHPSELLITKFVKKRSTKLANMQKATILKMITKTY